MRVGATGILIPSVSSCFMSACFILALERPVSRGKTLQNSAEGFRQLIMIELLDGIYQSSIPGRSLLPEQRLFFFVD